MSFKSLICTAVLAGVAGVASAQWTAFNDHYSGPGTAPFTTTWNVFGAGTGAAGSSGPLTNIVTGAVLPVNMAVTGVGQVGGTTAGAPNPGTPAYNVFNTFVDFGNGTLNHAIQMPDPSSPTPTTPAATVTTVFTGLNPSKRYKFTGTAVRGDATYINRWALYTLVSAPSFTSAHTAGCLTNGSAGVPPADISTSQVALNSGANLVGDNIVWDNIDPGSDGSFTVTAVTYRGTVPGGSSGGSYGYALAAIKLEEFDTTPVQVAITNQPQSQTVGELQSVTFSAGVAGNNPTPTFQWYSNNVAIPGANSLTFSIPVVKLSANGAAFHITAAQTFSGDDYLETSADAILTVTPDTTRPVIVSAGGQPPSLVTAIFSEGIRTDTATNLDNYVITNSAGVPLIINSAALSGNGLTVTLTTEAQVLGSTYTLVVNGIRDLSSASNLIAANSLASFSSVSFVPGDVGPPVPAGTAVAVGNNGYNITAGGLDIGGTSDQFSWEYQTIIGDFDVKVRLAGLTLSDVWAKAGIMARESTNVGSAFAASLETAGSAGAIFESRSSTGAAATTAGYFPANLPNAWLRLQRVGNVFNGYAGFDGSSWTLLGTLNSVLANSLLVGMVVTSHTNTVAATAQFRDFNSIPPGGATINSQPFPIEPPGPSSRRTPFAITEIMSKPFPATDASSNSLEFIEIYNSNPFFEEISKFKLAGDIDYTFPANTFLQANQYVVIAANPGAIQAKYGITGVMGPYTNSLKSSGTVKLINNSGGEVLVIPYSNDPPWPVAADGAGHSMVLAKPSYGEDDPHAWAASDQLGGSPGRMDGYSATPQRNVVINEFLANSQISGYDYIELYNHSSVAVEITGCSLSDSPTTNKFVITTPTTIPARGFVVYYSGSLGFCLGAGGETLYFRGPNGAVLDVVKYEDQSQEVSYGRYPDGAKDLYPLSAQSPGGPNANILIRDVVINEIMAKPLSGSSDDTYVELYNKGTNAISLSKWKFTSGISYTFPTNAVIPADGYVVLAKNLTNFFAKYTNSNHNLNSNNCFGDFGGKLKFGDRLVLTLPELNVTTNCLGVVQTNNLHIAVDEVTFGAGGNWPKWVDQGGSSLELTDPRSNHRLAHNWAESDETQKAPWTAVECAGTMDNGKDGTGYFEAYLMGEGECLVDNIEMYASAPVTTANVIPNGTFDAGLGAWVLRGDHIRTTLDATNGFLTINGPSGGPCLHIRGSARGDSIINRLRIPIAGFPSSGNITIRYKARWLKGWPEVLMRTHGNYFDCVGSMTIPSNLGTPGARNSRAVTNAPPAIYEVRHDPVVPSANQAVVVTARRYDPDGIASMVLKYRIDPATTYTSVTMVDNGTGGDAIAGDGLYSATIPAQGSGTLVAFQIVATDNLGASKLFPLQDTTYPRVFECLVRFGDPMPSTAFFNYRQWVTSDNVSDWQNRQANSNERVYGTFVYGNFRAIYNMSSKWAGSPYHQFTGSPNTTSAHYSIAMPGDDLFLGESNINKVHAPGNGPFDDGTIQREQTCYWTARQLALPWGYRRFVNMYFNGNRMGGSTHMMEDSQTPGAEMLKEFYPNDADGDLFKLQPWFETQAETSTQATAFVNESWCTLLKWTTTSNGVPVHKTAHYRNNYLVRSAAETANDYSSVFGLIDAANSAPPSNSVLTSTFSAYADVEEMFRICACEHASGNWDSVGCRNEQNMYGYKPQNGKWQMIIWDWNIVVGSAAGPWDPGANLFIVSRTGTGTSPGPQGGDLDTVFQGFYDHPPFRRIYLRGLKEICNGPWAAGTGPGSFSAMIDAKQNAIAASGVTGTDPTSIKTYLNSARSSILSQIAAEDAASFSLGFTNFTTTNNLFVLNGVAPVEAKDLQVLYNGLVYPVAFTSVKSWTVNLVLASGTNQITIQGYDHYGNALPNVSTNLAIVYTGPPFDPRGSLVIDEIMYNPTVPDASYVEIYNNSTFSFDLSGWRLDGLDYVFPVGAVMPGKTYMTIAKSRAAVNLAGYTNALTPSITVFDEFPGFLDPRGQTIALVKPGATQVTDTLIAKVRYEPSAPWAPGANGQGSSLQLMDASQDISRVSNWSDGIGWKFSTQTGILGTSSNGLGSNVFLFVQLAGDVYIDDVSLVPLAGPSAGVNLIQNSDFEAPLNSGSSPWLVPAALSGSSLSSTYAHSGNSSLHVVNSASGNANTNSAVYQTFPRINTNILCTLSFWYHTGNSTNFTVRTFPGSAIIANINPKAIGTTPNTTNSTLVSLPAYQPLWLNEVQANNVSGPTDGFGEHEPWIELYNSGTNNISLDGYFLANNYTTNLTNSAFPSGSVISNGQFIIIWADGQSNQTSATEWHTSFRLDASTGSVALVRLIGPSATPQITDYLNYSGLNANESYGDYPDGQPFDRQTFYTTPTPGTNNYAPLVYVTINEWVASNQAGPGGYPDPADGKYDDWFELYNAGPKPADISGFYLTDTVANKLQWRIPSGTIIPPGGFRLVWADKDVTENTNTDLHANFNLNKGGEAIGLYALVGTNIVQVDLINFGAQNDNVSGGRYPDGSTNIASLTVPTPRAPNAIPNNRPPTLGAIANQTVQLGQTVSFTAAATDPDAGQTLGFGLAPGAPSGATIDGSSGVFHWTPSALQAPSTNTITVTATDNGSPVMSGSTSFMVVVTVPNNQPPVLASISDRDLVLGQSLSFTATATDPDAGQTRTFSLTTFPTGATMDSSGLFHWTPTSGQAPSSNPITVQVADNGSPVMTDSKSFTVRVALPPRGVIAASGGNVTLTFPTIPGKNYKVQYKDNLSEATWSDLGSSFTAGAGLTTTVNDTPGHNRFYRLLVID